MLINFFMELKKARIPVSITELLHLLEVLKARLVYADIDEFYYSIDNESIFLIK